MKVGYFCYRLSGNGPRTRAADLINAVARETDHEVAVLTNEPDAIDAPAGVTSVSLRDPVNALAAARRAFADADVVHVPINVYQVLFVRTVYRGPLVAGIGPGIQNTLPHRLLGRLLGIDTKIKVHEEDTRWERVGYETVVCMATLDTDVFYPYDDERVADLRAERGFDDETVVLYVGKLIEEQGAGIVDALARTTTDDDEIEVVVVGHGPMADRFRDRSDLAFEGFVDNKDLPEYYNVADVTVAPRRDDNTSNVGLESIACGTPMVTTASGTIERLFRERGTYVWADRTPEAVLEAVRDLTRDPERYEAQRRRGLATIDELPVTLDSALALHLDVYTDLTGTERATGQGP